MTYFAFDAFLQQDTINKIHIPATDVADIRFKILPNETDAAAISALDILVHSCCYSAPLSVSLGIASGLK